MARKMSNICELTAPDMLILAVRLIQPSIVFVVICGDSSHICLDPPAVVVSARALCAGIPDRSGGPASVRFNYCQQAAAVTPQTQLCVHAIVDDYA